MTPQKSAHIALFGMTMLLAALTAGSSLSRPDEKLIALPDRNGVNLAEKGLPGDWDIKKGTNIKWKAPIGKGTYGRVVIAGDRLFVGTNNDKPFDPSVKGDKGILACFQASDGKFLWQAVHDKLPDPNHNDWPDIGIVSIPVVEGNRVYYVSNRCEVVCADTAGDGGKAKILWSFDMIKELDVYPCYASASSPLIIGDLVFALTSNGVDPDDLNLIKPKAASFVAVDKKTGKLKWSSNLPGAKILYGQWSSPAAAQVDGKWQVIFPGGDGWLYGFEAESGKLLWKFDCNPKKSVYKKGGGKSDRNYLTATPVVFDNKVYIGVGQYGDAGGGVGHLWCVDLTKKPTNTDLDLSPVADNFDPKDPVNKDSGLVWHFGGLVMPKPAAGDREYIFDRTLSSVTVVDGLLYAADVAGFVYCLDAKTGKKHWEFDTTAEIWASPYYVDGKVYLGTVSGDMFVFEHGKTFKEPKKIEMGEGVYTAPVASKGVLYQSTAARLFAIAKK